MDVSESFKVILNVLFIGITRFFVKLAFDNKFENFFKHFAAHICDRKPNENITTRFPVQ